MSTQCRPIRQHGQRANRGGDLLLQSSRAATDCSVLLATWNVNSMRAHRAGVLDWLDVHRPNVVALQETMCAPSALPLGDFARLGYECAAVGSGASAGVALLSNVGLDDVQLGVPGAMAPLDEPRLVSATVGAIRVHGAYAPNGRKVNTPAHRAKLAWFHLLRAVVEADLDDERTPATVLLGDLNIAPANADIWAPERYRTRNLTSPVERATFEALLGVGLVDVVRRHFGAQAVLSSWWNRRGDFFESDRGWRLDHVLTDPSTAGRVSAVTIDRPARASAGTDHAPIVVSLDD